jgi:hypothetical protein
MPSSPGRHGLWALGGILALFARTRTRKLDDKVQMSSAAQETITIDRSNALGGRFQVRGKKCAIGESREWKNLGSMNLMGTYEIYS